MAPIFPTNLSIPAIAPLSFPRCNRQRAAALFKSVFADAVSKVESFQQNAQASVDRFLSGEGEELHHVAITDAAGGAFLSAVHAGAQQNRDRVSASHADAGLKMATR